MSKHEKDDLKPASNFELNVLKLGKNRFQLVKGDRFSSNGNSFNYQPSTSDNASKLPFSNYRRATSISAKKYQKDVERAENIKLISDKPLGEEKAGAEYNVHNRWRVWEVQYAYVQPVDSEEPLVAMVLELSWINQDKWDFKVSRHEIERNTKETYFLKQHAPVTYLTKLSKTDLNKAAGGNHKFYIIGEFADYNDLEEKLFKFAEAAQYGYIQSAKDLLRKEEENLSKFLVVKKSQGF